LQLIRPITPGLLFRLAGEELILELAVLTAKLCVFLLQGRDAPHGVRVSALPITRLLPQFEILPSQTVHLGPQPGYFVAESLQQLHHRGQTCRTQVWFHQQVFHDRYVLPEQLDKVEDQLEFDGLDKSLQRMLRKLLFYNELHRNSDFGLMAVAPAICHVYQCTLFQKF